MDCFHAGCSTAGCKVENDLLRLKLTRHKCAQEGGLPPAAAIAGRDRRGGWPAARGRQSNSGGSALTNGARCASRNDMSGAR